MSDSDLRGFISRLESLGELRRVGTEVSPRLEMTEICDRVLRAAGPAVLFERPTGHRMPVLANLFGTPKRVALGMGAEENADPATALRDIGRLLAFLKEPDPPKGMRDVLERWLPIGRQVFAMAPREISRPACQEIRWEGTEVDLERLPVQIGRAHV